MPSFFVYSDASASDHDCGGSVMISEDDYVCHKMWKDCERLQSSTWRELNAIEFSLQSLGEVIVIGIVATFLIKGVLTGYL